MGWLTNHPWTWQQVVLGSVAMVCLTVVAVAFVWALTKDDERR